MSHVVMIARALLDPKTFDQVLTEDRLAELDGLIEDGTYVRGSRNPGGWLADSVDSAGEYVDVPEDARDELPDMTRSLAHEDYECETSEYLSRITKTAMGLAGTAFHVPDLPDIDVVWEGSLTRLQPTPGAIRGGQCRVVSNDALRRTRRLRRRTGTT